jgi:hypothetical protein
MASLTRGTTFVDGVANDVTAAKLSALVDNATPTSGFIKDRTQESIIATNDTLLFGDASDTDALKRITVANFAQTLPTAKVTTGTIDTGTFGTTTSTAATITTLTAGTTTSTAATITTGTIPTLTSITKITSGTGTAAAPAISPTGDTNTGIFFPDADTVAFSEGGAESMRINSSGKVLVNSTTEKASILSTCKLQVYDSSLGLASNTDYTPQIGLYSASTTVGAAPYFIAARSRGSIETPAAAQNGDQLGNIVFGGHDGSNFITPASITSEIDGTVTTGAVPSNLMFTTGSSSGVERMRINSAGNVGIGTTTATAAFQGAASKLGIEAPRVSSDQTLLSLAHTGTITASDKINIGFDSFSSTAARRTMAQISALNENPASGNPGSLLFYTNVGAASLTEKMRIDSAGNASIGTATALSRLHVHGDLTMSNATTATSASTGGVTIPATVAGYLSVTINGTSRRIPYFAA